MFEVKNIEPDSPANRSGVLEGDKIISINGEELTDYIDYIFFCSLEKLKIKLVRGGKQIILRMQKNEEEDLGLTFKEPMLGKKRVCSNKCVFCFVDQLPKGMRKSLYVKDEDWRYSLLMGNYVTLSSISTDELKRIIRRKASPLYISVHTVDEDLRRDMLGNPDALPIKPLLKKLAAHGIKFHAQVVICPGMNDGEKLEETLAFLYKLNPAALSLAVVPVGLTAHRKKQIPPVTKEGAKEIIERVEKWQKECLNGIKTRFVFASDELYIRAGLPLPKSEEYESFAQIENGVGLMRRFIDDAESALEGYGKPAGDISIATGEDAYTFFKELVEKAGGNGKRVYIVKNKTFGGGVTVSGLLAGNDFLEALSGKDLGEKLLISADSLRDGVFLDDINLSGLEQDLKVKIVPVTDGFKFAQLLCGVEE